MSEQMTFIDRLTRVADGRKLYPWLMEMGLSSATVARMRKNKIPGPEHLTVICRAENVSLSWLLEGKGVPYMVARFDDDESLAGYIEAHLDENWEQIYPLSDARGLRAVVMVQPGYVQLSDKKGTPFTAIEVAAGPVGDRTMEAVKAWCLETNGQCHPNTLTRTELADVISGQVGTWQLLERPNPILKKTDPGHVAELRSAYSTADDPLTVQDVADMMRVLSPELQERVKAYVEGITDAVDSVTGDERSGK
ncbi:hypothetical protein FAZ79_00365 [Guyparkeria sp. SB14A]|uniref:helix-turn-helix domain-containing protein n=1 Tax=Guyparkeria sp. SB14A TaxID=2571147 RepID=UPI0010AD5EA2|nr:hypothetical protein [Guyparkeria sp. SB14A]TKA91793.1 hypothetical protein FAZ79_00365 [Guyparkeria sp. SB14A]